MKKILIIIIYIVSCNISFCQDSDSLLNKLPSIILKNIDGLNINVSHINNDGKPFIICFWKTCCHIPNKLLSAINEDYEDWKEETGVKIYIISIDDSRSTNRVKPFVNGQGWEFDVLLDPNSDLKRAMNVYSVPYLFLLDESGEIVWQKTSFMEGDEEEIHEKIIDLITK